MGCVGQFVNLHVHSDFSSDSNSKAALLAEYAQVLGQTALALTDHGTPSGWLDFERECVRVGIKGIKGVEAYYQPTFEKEAPRYHLTLLARTQAGLKNLTAMCSRAAVEQFHGKPTITQADLLLWHDGLIVLSGCRSAYLPRMILEGNYDLAISYATAMRQLLGENFFLEVQPHGDADQMQINDTLIQYGLMLDIAVVMTTDAHYIRAEDFGLYEVGVVIRKKNPDQTTRQIYEGRHIHSYESVCAAWKTLMGGNGALYAENAARVADMCEPTSIKREFVVPHLADDADAQLARRAKSALTERLRQVDRLENGRVPQVYRDALLAELAVYKARNFSGYMLTCADIFAYAREHGILGNIRGSGAGSLVLYAFGGLVDPLRWGTSIERFFSLERTDPPDVDFDFGDQEKIIEFLMKRYPGSARRIVNYGRLQLRSLMKPIAAHYGMNSIEKEQMTAALAAYGTVDIDEQVVRQDGVLSELEEQYPGVLDAYFHFIHSVSYLTQHAAGVFITDGPIDALVPTIYQASSHSLLTAWDMRDLEWAKLGIKFDILGVDVYNQLKACMALVGLTELDVGWLEDPCIYEALRRGDSDGIFQLDASWKAKKMLREAKVSCFEDVAAVVACVRPGSSGESGSWEAFLHGGDNNRWLDPFTADTRHALMYQEQVIYFCKWLGMTGQQIDRLIKHLKKFKDEDPELRALFVDACVAKGIPSKEAVRLRELTRRYSFNKAHNITYTMLACFQTYLREKYPTAWYYASLLAEAGDKQRRPRMEAEAVRHGLSVLPAHVNGEVSYSQVWTPDGEAERFVVRRGLSAIPNVGEGIAAAIVAERKHGGYFSSLGNFEQRFEGKRYLINKTRLQALLGAGALEFDAAQVWENDVAEQTRLCGLFEYL